MKYFKPEMEIIEFAVEDILTTSEPTPTPSKSPVIEQNDAIQELADAFSSVFDFSK